MNCPRCETPNIDQARFCSNCGAEVSALIPSDQAPSLAGNADSDTGALAPVASAAANGNEITKVVAPNIVGGGAVGSAVAPIMQTDDDEVTRVSAAVSRSEA